MQTRSRLLCLLFLIQAFCIISCRKNDGFGTAKVSVDYDTVTPLKEAADFPIGVAISYSPILNDPAYVSIVKRDFDAVTFDYNMKHGAIVQSNGTLDFSKAD